MEKPGGEDGLDWAGMGGRFMWAAVRDKTREPEDSELCVLRTVSMETQRRIWGFRKIKIRKGGKEQDRKPQLYIFVVQGRESLSIFR